MYQSRITILTILLFVMTAGSCKKEDKDNTDVTFTNNLSEKVTLDIYASEEDYASGNNRLLRKTLNAQENTVLPGNTFKTGQTYYMDWYSDKYYYHNWFNDNYPVGKSKVMFKPVPGNNTYYFNHESSGGARAVFLQDNKTSSRWTAVTAFTHSSSTGYIDYWSQLSADERYREVTVNKNFKVLYSHKDNTGKLLNDEISFMVHNTKEPYIEMMDASSQSAGSLILGSLPSADGSEHISESQDSLMALFPDSDFYFLMVRSQ
jgi:hypothetical protein